MKNRLLYVYCLAVFVALLFYVICDLILKELKVEVELRVLIDTMVAFIVGVFFVAIDKWRQDR